MTYAAKIEKSEARIDWSAGAGEIDRRVRAFNPWPMAETSFAGEPLRVLRARVAEQPGARCGARRTLFGIAEDGLRVACGEGVLAVRELQRAGKRPMSRARFRQRRAARRPEIRHVKPAGSGRSAPASERAAHATRPVRRRSAHAALAVHAVVNEGRSADAALEAAQDASIARRCGPSRSARCAGTCGLRPAVAPLVSRPFEELSPKLAALLVTAAHQVEYSRGAPEAQVHLAVDASRIVGEVARQRRGQRGTAPVRARSAPTLLAGVDADPPRRHAHPRWLVRRAGAAWGEPPTASSPLTTCIRR